MQEESECRIAVACVGAGVENVIVPEDVEILAPRHDRLARIRGYEVEESTIILFASFASCVCPALLQFEFFFHVDELQSFDLRGHWIHARHVHPPSLDLSKNAETQVK